MTVDEQIRAALRARAEQVTEADLTPADPPTSVARRSRVRWLAPALAAAAVVGVAVTTAVVVSQPSASHSQRPGGPSVSTGRSSVRHNPPPVSTTSSDGLSSEPDGSLGRSMVCYFGDASPCRVPPDFVWYVPLWPFANYQQARQWVTQGAPNGASPWHADPKATAQFFVQNFLGFQDLGLVTSSKITADQARIGIGYRDPGGTKRTAAVVHLVRYEHYADDKTAPWEVVGTDDTTFSLERPAYGSRVRSPLVAGGHITGVDENIRLWVRSLTGGVVGSYCCQPAGGNNSAWSVKITWRAPAATPLTVVAVTGGHVQAHERFAIQGVWASA
jgi:hypothetical protein